MAILNVTHPHKSNTLIRVVLGGNLQHRAVSANPSGLFSQLWPCCGSRPPQGCTCVRVCVCACVRVCVCVRVCLNRHGTTQHLRTWMHYTWSISCLCYHKELMSHMLLGQSLPKHTRHCTQALHAHSWTHETTSCLTTRRKGMGARLQRSGGLAQVNRVAPSAPQLLPKLQQDLRSLVSCGTSPCVWCGGGRPYGHACSWSCLETPHSQNWWSWLQCENCYLISKNMSNVWIPRMYLCHLTSKTVQISSSLFTQVVKAFLDCEGITNKGQWWCRWWYVMFVLWWMNWMVEYFNSQIVSTL